MNPRKETTMNKRKFRLGDRSDGYKLRTLDPFIRILPFIMPKRSDSLNMFSSRIEISAAERYIRQKHEEGYTNFGLLHLLLAAYVRTVSQRPAINRFVSGQQIYARKNIEIIMTVKKDMTLDAPETSIKMQFEPTVTPIEVYEKFNKLALESKTENSNSGVDQAAKFFNYIPRFFMRFVMFILRALDYYGLLPKFLLNISPFHGSLVVTSMGSLGIPPVFHHIYDFGNVPVFIAFGKRHRVNEINDDGSIKKSIYSDICIVTDERICDGFYYASAFKMVERLMRNPHKLDTPPETVEEDIN